MKVNITKESKQWMTVAQLPIARQIVKELKENDDSADEYIRSAAWCWLWNVDKKGVCFDCAVRVIEASAEIAGNSRVHDAYFDGSGELDVWLKGLVETDYGFLRIECYLTDVWNIGPDDFNAQFPGHCFARYYAEQK